MALAPPVAPKARRADQRRGRPGATGLALHVRAGGRAPSLVAFAVKVMFGAMSPAQPSVVATLLRLAVMQKDDWDCALQQLLEVACDLLDLDRVSYWSLTDDRSCLLCELGYVRSRRLFERGGVLRERDCPEYFTEIQRVQVMTIEDANTDPRVRCLDPYLASRRVGAMLDAPVFAQGRMVGVLCHERVDQKGQWTQHDSELALTLSHALSSLLAARARNDAERSERQAAFLAQTATALAATLDPEHAAEIIVRRAIPILGDIASLSGHDGQRSWPMAHAHAEPKGQAILDELRGRFKGDIEGSRLGVEALRQGQSLLLPMTEPATLRASGLDEAYVALLEQLRVRSVMSVLLRVRAEVIGVLTIASCTRTYDREDLRFAEAYAEQVGTLMDNTRLLAQAREALRARDDFLQLAGHELRTPLAALNFAVEVVKKGIVPQAPAVQRALDTITRQATRLSRLTELIVAASEHAEGKPPLRTELLDLAALVREVARDFESLFKQEACELRLSAAEPVPMQGDPVGLEVVVSNLFSNAMKFGATMPIEVFVRGTDETAKLVVIDHGVGIPDARSSAVSARHERGGPAQHFGGLGLGLYIASQIVEAHGGTIRVDSEPDEGVAVTVELPRRPR
jgi:signal transduction histidine kinase